MNLELLLARAEEIENAILQATNQLNALYGHKAETAHWIQKAKEATPEPTETPVEVPVEPVVE